MTAKKSLLQWWRIFSFFLIPWSLLSAFGAAWEGQRPEEGKTLYLRMCAACHGDDARGGGWGGPDLTQVVPRWSEGRLFATIRAGVPGTGMRGTTTLTDEEIWAIVTYLRTLSP